MNADDTTPETPPPPDPLAVALSKLDPAPHGFDRDALMFAAGRESKMRLINLWRTLAGLALAAAVVFATLYFTKAARSEVTSWPSVGTKR
jgi:hypothetical protein